ncbi:MAG: hypothetical protein ACRC9K_22720 [Afipia sp.]
MNALKTVANSKHLVTILTLAAVLLIDPDSAFARNRGGGGSSMGSGPKPQPVTRTVRDHRTLAPATVRDHRAPPKVTDHRAKPTVTDHRKQSKGVLGVRKVQSPARGGVRVTSNGPRKPKTAAPQPGLSSLPNGGR